MRRGLDAAIARSGTSGKSPAQREPCQIHGSDKTVIECQMVILHLLCFNQGCAVETVAVIS